MNNKGYTLIELIIVIFGLVSTAGTLYITYLIIRALQKYIG